MGYENKAQSLLSDVVIQLNLKDLVEELVVVGRNRILVKRNFVFYKQVSDIEF